MVKIEKFEYISSTETGEPILKIEGKKITALKDCVIYINGAGVTAKEKEVINIETEKISGDKKNERRLKSS